MLEFKTGATNEKSVERNWVKTVRPSKYFLPKSNLRELHGLRFEASKIHIY